MNEATGHAQYPGGALTKGCPSFTLLVVSAEQSLGQFSPSLEVFSIGSLLVCPKVDPSISR